MIFTLKKIHNERFSIHIQHVCISVSDTIRPTQTKAGSRASCKESYHFDRSNASKVGSVQRRFVV